jgi:hypothetical protein
MNGEVVTSLYCHNHLISFIMLDHQRKSLMRTDVKRREIWEWSDHTQCMVASALSRDALVALFVLRIDTLNRQALANQSWKV